MQRMWKNLALVVGVFVGLVASADYTFEYAPGKKCSIGGDIRLRLTRFDRNAIRPSDWGPNNGPALEYMRVRERVWGCFEMWQDVHLNLRLVNRWQRFSSAPWSPNNQAYAYDDNDGTNTWQFPDEVIFDKLNLNFQNVMDSNWSIKIGRQDIMFGNGMVWLEGTPFDQGRTIYFDGIRATYANEKDTVDLVAVRNGYKDNFLVINDRERPLRLGDLWAAGIYWTHHQSQKFNTDLYYFYVNFDGTDVPVQRAQNSYYDDTQLHVVGARVFGSPTDQVSYSLEAARQFGCIGSYSAQDATGSMVDARLSLKAAEGTRGNPVLSFEYTYWSGDDPSSNSEFEGWHPVFSEYPIWREELLPILINGNWTNLHQFRTQVGFDLSKKVHFTGAWAVLRTDYGDDTTTWTAAPAHTGSNGDGGFGHLLSAFIDYKATDALAVALEASAFRPSNYWDDGHNSTWIRLQFVYTFLVNQE